MLAVNGSASSVVNASPGPRPHPQPRSRVLPWRTAFLLPAGLSLLAGLDAALLLLHLPAPVTTTRLPEVHGMLLVLGFVGTLVALERAVALGARWGLIAPVASAHALS